MPTLNDPIVFEQVDNGPTHSHVMTVPEGNNDDLESYEGPKLPEVQRNDEHRGYCKLKNLMNCKPSSFNAKKDPVGIMGWIAQMDSTFLKCACTVNQQTTYDVRQFKGMVMRWWNTLEKILIPNNL